MKWLVCCFLFFISTSLHAQQKFTDSTINIDLPALDLTAEQKIALKKLVWEYKMEDRRRRKQLRHRMFLILNVRQQAEVRRWWRRQIKSSIKRQ
jgi:hypothetical protein